MRQSTVLRASVLLPIRQCSPVPVEGRGCRVGVGQSSVFGSRKEGTVGMYEPADDATSDRRHIIPDHLYIAEYPDTIGRAFIDLAESLNAAKADRDWFNRRVADSIEQIRDAHAFTSAQRDGTIAPTSQEVAENHQRILAARGEIFDALQELLAIT